MTNEQIAERLGMSIGWVNTHPRESPQWIEKLDNEEAIKKALEPLSEDQRRRAESLIKIRMESNGGRLPDLPKLLARIR